MNILLIQRDGVDLHHTLFASETSRLVLRFYHPKKNSCGVYITVSTLGSALSLVSELRWYIRRYVKETLFEVTPGNILHPHPGTGCVLRAYRGSWTGDGHSAGSMGSAREN